MKRNPRSLPFMLYLYPLTLPFYGFSFLNVGGRGLLRPDWLFGLMVIMTFFANYMLHKIRLAYYPANRYICIFIYFAFIGLINLFDASSDQMVDFLTKAFQLILVTTVFFVISNSSLTGSEMQRILRAWILMALITSVYAIYQVFARQLELPLAYINLTNPTIAQGGQTGRTLFGYTQPSSFLREPSYLGSYLAGPFIFLLVFTLKMRNQGLFSPHFLNWLIISILFLAIFLSGSQGIYASLSSTFVILCALGFKIRKRTLVVLAAGLFLLLAMGLFLDSMDITVLDAIKYRTTELLKALADPSQASQVTSFANRYERSVEALRIWCDHPILGVGLGNMAYHTDVYAWTNNPWLQVLVEQGVLGIVPMILLFASILSNLGKAARSQTEASSLYEALSLAMFFVIILDICDGFFTLTWFHPQRWFTLSLGNVLSKKLHKDGVELSGCVKSERVTVTTGRV